MSLIDFIESNSKLSDASEIIFYGGSFNPWHDGHASCLRLSPKDIPVIVIPDHNPFKNLVDHNSKASTLKELRIQLNSFERKPYLFEDFAVANTKNPTNVWFAELSNNFPNKRLSMLMGFDTFITIDRWINAEILLEQVTCLYVVDRLNDDSLKQDQIKRLSSFKNLEIIFLGEHPHEEVSSTQIREKLNSLKK
jgi:nicotinate-nucleotide adenylyltransferase